MMSILMIWALCHFFCQSPSAGKMCRRSASMRNSSLRNSSAKSSTNQISENSNQVRDDMTSNILLKAKLSGILVWIKSNSTHFFLQLIMYLGIMWWNYISSMFSSDLCQVICFLWSGTSKEIYVGSYRTLQSWECSHRSSLGSN